AIHPPRHHATEEPFDLDPATRCGEGCPTDVPVEVEVRIVDPRRSREIQHHSTYLLAVPGNQRQPAADRGDELAEVRSRPLEDGERTDRERCGRVDVLGLEEAGGEGSESVHPITLISPRRSLQRRKSRWRG